LCSGVQKWFALYQGALDAAKTEDAGEIRLDFNIQDETQAATVRATCEILSSRGAPLTSTRCLRVRSLNQAETVTEYALESQAGELCVTVVDVRGPGLDNPKRVLSVELQLEPGKFRKELSKRKGEHGEVPRQT
jgi:hypothetical protein